MVTRKWPETGSNTVLCRGHIMLPSQLSMHKIRNTENKGTDKTKMSRAATPTSPPRWAFVHLQEQPYFKNNGILTDSWKR